MKMTEYLLEIMQMFQDPAFVEKDASALLGPVKGGKDKLKKIAPNIKTFSEVMLQFEDLSYGKGTLTTIHFTFISPWMVTRAQLETHFGPVHRIISGPGQDRLATILFNRPATPLKGSIIVNAVPPLSKDADKSLTIPSVMLRRFFPPKTE